MFPLTRQGHRAAPEQSWENRVRVSPPPLQRYGPWLAESCQSSELESAPQDWGSPSHPLCAPLTFTQSSSHLTHSPVLSEDCVWRKGSVAGNSSKTGPAFTLPLGKQRSGLQGCVLALHPLGQGGELATFLCLCPLGGGVWWPWRRAIGSMQVLSYGAGGKPGSWVQARLWLGG